MAALLRLSDELEKFAQQSKYSPAKLAELVGVSLRGLERQFQTQLGCSPVEYLIKLRMTKARRLLFTGMSVKAVAYELGYLNVSNFCNDFKARNAISALQFVAFAGRAGYGATEQNPPQAQQNPL